MSNTPNLERFIKDTIFDLVSNEVSIELTHRKTHFNFFDEDNKQIQVRIQDTIKEWGLIFIHEYCHYLQWKDGKYGSPMYGEAGGEIHLWIRKRIKLNKERVNLIANRIKRCELDCEKRVVNLINKYKLEVDTKSYIRNANAYVFSYNMIKERREWYKLGPQCVPEIIDIMPETFLSRYDRTPDKYRQLYLEHCI